MHFTIKNDERYTEDLLKYMYQLNPPRYTLGSFQVLSILVLLAFFAISSIYLVYNIILFALVVAIFYLHYLSIKKKHVLSLLQTLDKVEVNEDKFIFFYLDSKIELQWSIFSCALEDEKYFILYKLGTPKNYIIPIPKELNNAEELYNLLYQKVKIEPLSTSKQSVYESFQKLPLINIITQRPGMSSIILLVMATLFVDPHFTDTNDHFSDHREYSEDDQTTTVNHLLSKAFSNSDTSKLYAIFSEQLKSRIPPEQLSEIFNNIHEAIGKYINSGDLIALDKGYHYSSKNGLFFIREQVRELKFTKGKIIIALESERGDSHNSLTIKSFDILIIPYVGRSSEDDQTMPTKYQQNWIKTIFLND